MNAPFLEFTTYQVPEKTPKLTPWRRELREMTGQRRSARALAMELKCC